MKVLLVMMGLLSLQATAHANYSIFDVYVDPKLTSSHKIRLNEAIRQGETPDTDVNVGRYKYNKSGKVTQRAYLDGTFNYEYNNDGTLYKASSLMDHGDSMIIQHTKENFISEYTYENGRVISEIKKVYSTTASNLDGDPEATYTISYLYNEDNQLIQRNQVSTNNQHKIVYDYTYNSDNRLSKIYEIKTTGHSVTNRDLLYLTYNHDGEISKAEHKKKVIGPEGVEEVLLKTVDINYYSHELVYPFHYVDPVKEWKVDRDFFALSYYPISEITTTEQSKETKRTKITYEYVDNNADFAPESFTSIMTVSGADPADSMTKQYNYILKYPQYTTRISAFNSKFDEDSYRIGFKLPVATHAFMPLSTPLFFRESINDELVDYSHHGYGAVAPETIVQYAVKSELTGTEIFCGNPVPAKGTYYIFIEKKGCELILYP